MTTKPTILIVDDLRINSMNKTKIAGACLNQTPIDWNNNTSNILQAISQAQKENV